MEIEKVEQSVVGRDILLLQANVISEEIHFSNVAM